MQSDDRRRKLFGPVVAASLTVLMIVVLELGAGLFVESPEERGRRIADKEDTVSSTLAWLWTNPAPLIEDIDLLWRNQPSAERTLDVNPRTFYGGEQWNIRNNSQGFRGPELEPLTHRKGTYRILCIGDSVTFGYNTDQNTSYPRQLEAILERRYPDREIEVINAGTPGWTWLQGLRFLVRHGVALEPDLVIMAHGVNDQFMRARVTDRERFEHIDRPSVRVIARLRRLVAGTNLYRVIEQSLPRPRSTAVESPGCVAQRKSTKSCKRVALPEIESAVLAAHRIAEAERFDLLVLNLDFLRTPAVDAVGRTAASAGIEFLDLVQRIARLRDAAEKKLAGELGLAGADRINVPPPGAARGSRDAIFRVMVRSLDPRYTVRGSSVFGAKFEFNEMLVDDGSRGDEVAGDGVFSATLSVPPSVGRLSFMFYSDEEPEFQSLPPATPTFGSRNTRLDERLMTPVYRFAERFMMAERTHPNADGHAVIAAVVADVLERFSSFRHLNHRIDAGQRVGPSDSRRSNTRPIDTP